MDGYRFVLASFWAGEIELVTGMSWYNKIDLLRPYHTREVENWLSGTRRDLGEDRRGWGIGARQICSLWIQKGKKKKVSR